MTGATCDSPGPGLPSAPFVVGATTVEAQGESAESEPPASALSEEVQSAFEYMPATLAGMVAGAGVVSLLFWDLAPRHVCVPWLGAFSTL